jgi:hypothetical protein
LARLYNIKAIMFPRTIFAIIIFWIPIQVAFGGWKQIGQLPLTPSCGFFWNVDSGFVGGSIRGVDPFDGSEYRHASLYKTTDRGKHWTNITLPTAIANLPLYSYITSIWMSDSLHGWFTASAGGNPTWSSTDLNAITDSIRDSFFGVFQTSDGGNTWVAVPGSHQWLCLKQTAGGTVFMADGGCAPINDSICMISLAAITPHFNRDPSLQYSYPWSQNPDSDTNNREQSFFLTTDAGKTWTQTNRSWSFTSPQDHYGLFYLPFYHAFFSFCDWMANPNNHLIYSTDSGQNWLDAAPIPVLPVLRGGPIADVEGYGNAIYVQTEVYFGMASSGLFRSTDFGQSWQAIGGPLHSDDSRFCVPPSCRNGTVIAFDDSGGVWETIDGGDGALSPLGKTAASVATVPKTQSCSSSRTTAVVFSESCPNVFSLSSATLVGDTIHFSLDSLPQLPESLGGGARDSFYVRFDPLKQAGTFSTKLHITGTTVLPDTSYPFDTIITVTATSTPVTPQLTASSNAFDFAPTSRCSTSDTSIVFRNIGCAPDTLTNVSFAAEGITWLPDSLPIIIQPGDSIALRFHFAPAGTAKYSGTATLTVISMGLTETEMISFSGQGLPGTASLASTLASPSYTFATRTNCGTADSLDFFFTNPGCDTLKILSAHLNSAGNISAINIGGERSNLFGGDTLRYRWIVSPRDTGSSQSTIAITYQLPDGSIHDTMFTALATVVPGNSVLAVDTALRNLGVVYVCQQRDTIITLYNTGCDTLRITGGSFSGTNGTYASNATYPIIIPPGDSAKEEILFTPDTTGHPLSISGNFIITSDANSGQPTQTIPLTTSIIYPVHLTLSLLKSDSATDGSIVTFYLLLGGGQDVRSTSLRALHFDLTHNDDLLSLVSATGAGLNHFRLPGTAGSTHDSFTVAPISSSDTIGTLTFQVYLTKDSTTTLTLSNITFDTPASLSPDCIASLGDSGSVFSYIYSCSDRTLQHFMQTGSPFTIESIVPNPARDEIQISILRKSSEPIAFELYDVLGKRVVKKASLEARSTLDVSTIPEGTYYLRASASGEVQTRRIVIER